MANGKTHAKDSIDLGTVIGPVVAGGSYALWGDLGLSVVLGLMTLLGSWMGVLFTPDLDMETRTLVDRLPIIGPLWSVLWYPYAWAIPHRSWLSHTPLLGTAIRQLYFWGIVWVVLSPEWVLDLPGSMIYWAWFVGLFTSDVAHWTRDF